MRRGNGLLGLIGLVLLLFAVVAYAITGGRGRIDQIYIAINAMLGLLAVIAYLTTGIENLREFLGERSTKYGASTILGSLLFVGILIGLNILSYRYHRKFDLTERSVYSLSPQSAQVVGKLERDLSLAAFVEGGVNPGLRDLFDSYKYASPKVSYQMIDPERSPELAEQNKITAYNTVLLKYGDASTSITDPSEEAITNAIIKVTRAEQQTVCIVEGHGEPDIEAVQDARGLSQAKAALTNENYQVKKILLLNREDVPPECSVVIVAGPTKPYLAHELEALKKYLRGGGRAMFLLGPRGADEFVPFLEEWGVKLGDDLVVDQVLRLFQGPAIGLEPLIETYGTHEITRDFKGRTIFPMTRSVAKNGDKAGIQVTELVKSSPSSWAETDMAGIFERHEATLDETDQKGPLSIAVVVEARLKDIGENKEGTTRLAVFGSVQFAENRNLDGGTFFNRDLFLNTIGWLVGQSDLLSIRPRTMRASQLRFSEGESRTIFYLVVLLLPEILLIAGLVVWWRRE